jgi:UDP-N-acetylmuramate: L-alanyl-gamma-D-glutamyl-meso-diaminopimelate ligase
MLDQGLAYTSGPQWLAEHLLRDKWVLAASGTHGKTTTSAMLAWILDYAGMSPGFLIGGVPADFGVSARAGDSDFFVVEADEYDTAFFDKRSKFLHYRPRTLTINNLEFDHADIFPDLAAIQRQFHHLLRCVPGLGRVVHPAGVANVDAVLAQGCWTPTASFSVEGEGDWRASLTAEDGSRFCVDAPGSASVSVAWSHCGLHNVENALAAMAAAQHVGVTPAISAEALSRFRGVKRRLEHLGTAAGVDVYDDFAHHPTAIASTLEGMRARFPGQRLIALIEPRSNTMRMGQHRRALAAATAAADAVFWYQPAGMNWSLGELVDNSAVRAAVVEDIDGLVAQVVANSRPGDRVVIMSNGGFGGIHGKLLAELEKSA